jgi:hypothetical protein
VSAGRRSPQPRGAYRVKRGTDPDIDFIAHAHALGIAHIGASLLRLPAACATPLRCENIARQHRMARRNAQQTIVNNVAAFRRASIGAQQ